jgi:3D-(3,5/4)-trihydroxycyclohexane-1,2-dione acylhydrolase (decyclizing)
LESESSQDISVNDAFKPVSRYWDRIYRPEQIITSLPEAMRVLTSPAQTGAVTLCLPQDVATEAFHYPVELFQKRIWRIPRSRADVGALQRAADAIRAAKKPQIIAGGGVLYSEATHALRRFVEQTGIPVGETMAGKGSLAYDNPLCLGAVGATGTSAANIVAKEADLIIGIGTRYSDFTTASKTQFQQPDVRFVNINVAEFDSHKHSAIPVTGDAKVALDELAELLSGYRNSDENIAQAQKLHDSWEAEVTRIYSIKTAESGLPFQGGLIGAVNETGDPEAVMVGAAGSLPGDLHKLWRTRHPKQYHLEYGFSCMGYEIAGGLGVKMADPEREVYVLVGDGSFLMMNADITTSVQEGFKLTIVLMDNQGFKSIGGLSRSLGQSGFGTRYVYPRNGHLVTDEAGMEVESLPIDLAQNAALVAAKQIDRTVVIHVTNDRYLGVPGYESWWDVPVAEVSELDSVNAAREEWAEMRAKERYFLG